MKKLLLVSLLLTWISSNLIAQSETTLLDDSLHLSLYDTAASVFKVTKRTFFEYDSGGLVIQKWTLAKDKSGNWKNYSLDTLTYSGPRLTKTITRQWDSQLNSWKNVMRFDHFYDTVHTLSNIITSNWNAVNEVWEYSEQYSYTYFKPEKVLDELHQSWNPEISSWINISRTTNTYTNNTLTGSLTEEWNQSLLSWQPISRNSNTWTSGKLTEVISEEYHSSSGTWENFRKQSFAYLSDLVSSTTTMNWSSNQWINSTETTYTYQEGKLLTELLRQWQVHLNDWRNAQQADHFLSLHEVFGIPETAFETRMIPNPVVSGQGVMLNIADQHVLFSIGMTGLDGKKHLNLKASSGEIFFIPRLAPGVYLLTATTPGKPMYYQKIIVNQ
jgi:hypothetical protein